MTAHKNPILSSIIDIFERLERSKLDEDVLETVEEPLAKVSDFLHVDKTEALFFSLIFSLQNREGQSVNLHQIAEYLDYPFLHLLEYRYALDSLENNSFIYMSDRLNVSPHSENNGYRITGTVCNCVIDGQPVLEIKNEEFDIETAINELLFIGDNFRDKVMDSVEYIRQIAGFEHKIQHLELFRTIMSKFPDDVESRILLYYFCYSVICGQEFRGPVGRGPRCQSAVFTFLPESSSLKRKRLLNKGKDVLLQKHLVEKFYCEAEELSHSTYVNYRLTKNGIRELFGADAANYILKDDGETEFDQVISALKEMSIAYEERTFISDKLNSLRTMETEFQKFDYFQKVKVLISDELNRWMYLNCVSDFLKGYESDLGKTLQDIYGKGSQYFTQIRSFLSEKHYLLDSGLLEINKNEIVEKTKITLTDKSIELIYGENADLYKKKSTSANILNPENLREKTLFYSSDVQEQIDMLEESLSQEKLTAIQKRLEEKNLPKGVAVILYGAPGTGKTETVYQLAKKTNRKILHVDISESKSMWFGESEKRIKKIFTDYRNLCKNCKNHNENMPVLLFNEADALISKRNSLENARSVDQTENAIQNILLEEMEKLDGIMIATTNLCENMDSAFERRFLFKIKYEKPGLESRVKIWMNKLNYLTREDAGKLAKEFDFSGGEIDNIVRKGEMNEIITGVKPDYKKLVELCKKERLEKTNGNKMGFAC